MRFKWMWKQRVDRGWSADPSFLWLGTYRFTGIEVCLGHQSAFRLGVTRQSPWRLPDPRTFRWDMPKLKKDPTHAD